MLVTLTNYSAITANVASITLNGANPEMFSTDALPSYSIPSLGSVTFGVTYMPTAGGAHAATLGLLSDVGPNPVSVALAGNGTSPPALEVTPGSLDFGSIGVGATSASQDVALKNTGGSR